MSRARPRSASAAGDAAPAFISQQVTAARRFYLKLRPRAPAGLAVVCGGWEQCAPDYRIDRRDFPYLGIEFVASGEGELSLDGRRHALRPGTLFAYDSRRPHRIATSREAPLLKYFVDAWGREARHLMAACRLAPGAVLQVSAIGDVRSAFDLLIALGGKHDRRTERTCALQFELLLHTIARSRGAGSVSERRARATFERCRQYIDNHFRQLGSVQAAAQACHVDTSHVCRLFRRFHDESPLRYLHRLRMQWAADRLHGSGALVREVADDLGMDAFHFSRTFKRIHGVSPLAFLRTRG